jgi:hypothetical protein
LIEPGEQIIRLIDDNDRPARDCADRVGNEERCDPLASIGLGAFFARLAAKLDREADASAERLGELALACSRRPVEEKVRGAARRASETSSARNNPGGEIAQVANRGVLLGNLRLRSETTFSCSQTRAVLLWASRCSSAMMSLLRRLFACSRPILAQESCRFCASRRLL